MLRLMMEKKKTVSCEKYWVSVQNHWVLFQIWVGLKNWKSFTCDVTRQLIYRQFLTATTTTYTSAPILQINSLIFTSYVNRMHNMNNCSHLVKIVPWLGNESIHLLLYPSSLMHENSQRRNLICGMHPTRCNIRP